MSDTIITVENLGKRYSLRHLSDQRYVALRDVLVEKATGLFKRNGKARTTGPKKEDFWALKDVSFEVRQGEVVGIIGRNGAGKSTLLKILSRITEPTEGRVRIKGRVASLLEVGTGFHPELTGRENIFLNGAILGMGRTEIKSKFDEIVAFAEVEKFLDTPVKRYSSGMYVRLAFAVAAHLEPEILVIDEVLAVGDAEFQKKCLGKMETVARGGRTVIFVSHNMAAVEALCEKSIQIAGGRVVGIGPTPLMVASYLDSWDKSKETDSFQAVDLGEELALSKFRIGANPVRSGESLPFELEFESKQRTKMTELAILLYTSQGSRLAILDLRDSGLPKGLEAGDKYSICGEVKRLNLVEGDYCFGIYATTTHFSGNLLDLVRVTVSPPQEAREAIRYASAYRGFVELDFSARPTLSR